MPTYNPSQLHEMVQALLPDNVNNDIKAADARAVLDAIVDSFYNLVSTPNPTAPNLANVLLEGNESGPKDLLMSTGRYLVFKDAMNNLVRIRPMQQMVGTILPKDLVLPAKSGTIALLEDMAKNTWLAPVAAELAAPSGTEPNGSRLLVALTPTGLFTGKAGQVATKVGAGWEFSATNDGDVVRCMADLPGAMRMKVGGVWIAAGGGAGNLSTVLTVGNTTTGKDVEVSPGDAVSWKNNGFLMRLIANDIAEDHEVLMPDADGTLATLEQVSILLNALNLHTVLVNGNETNGRSITVSEFDGVNFKQGANQVRLKAPASVGAARNLMLPDKSGTVATTDDVAAVAALVDGTMRPPEAYVPSGGLYPATYGGGTIKKGDTFRLGAGTMGTRVVDPEDLLIAMVASPGQADANWQVLESNRVTATQAEAENSASTDTAKLVPPQRWWQAWTKGLTLTSFFTAVRGTTVGDSSSLSGTLLSADSMTNAARKAQTQINAANTAIAGKLDKASNLGDLSNSAIARGNLGLGSLATQNIARYIGHDQLEQVKPSGAWVTVGSLLDRGADGIWTKATNRVLAMATRVPGPDWVSEVSYGGRVIDPVFAPLTPGRLYYADPSNPGRWTAEPYGPPVFVHLGLSEILFLPQQALTPANTNGMVQISSGVVTNKTPADGGVSVFGSLLDTYLLERGCYRVDVHLSLKLIDTTHTGTPGAIAVSVAPWPFGGPNPAYGNVTIVQQVVGESGAKSMVGDKQTAVGVFTVLPDVPDNSEVMVVMSGIMNLTQVPIKPIKVRIGVGDSNHEVSINGMSFVVWNRIKGMA